ncbi:hypothetical protein BGAL_0107g00270 [Botrytis galanthina]|uniref:Uncharacterized protein n=1 Tax=Botrytis galanthina TaxID=278940 RepID=A0A4S8RDM1_9HELO|nr:hypothetical protein BGAL_0107g00270 [Botrytis galanthina]
MTNGENKREKMTSDRVDDTNEAAAAGKLPDRASDKSNLEDSLEDTTKLQININGKVDCEMSRFERFFYKMKTQKETKESAEDARLREALLWPGGEEWRVKSETPLRVKKQSPLRQVMSA